MNGTVIMARALLFAALFFGRPASADTVVVDDTFDELSLGKHLELAYDASGELTVGDALAGRMAFVASKKDVPSFGFRSGAEWMEFGIDDRRHRRSPLYVECGHPVTDYLDLFATNERGEVTRFVAGDHVAFAKWPIRTRLPSFALPPDATRVFVRVAGDASRQLPFTLRSESNWYEHRGRETAILATYYGALVAMLLYNALVWAAVGIRLYGYYVAVLLSYGVFSLAYNGSLYATVLGASTWVNDHALTVLMGAVRIFSIRFVLGLLELGERRPFFVRIGTMLQRVEAAFILASLVISNAAGLHGTFGLALPWLVFLLACATSGARRGERSAVWYLVAWSAFLGGTLVNVLRTIGVLPTNAITSNAHQVGSALEFLLLSFALAERIKSLQAEVGLQARLAADNANLAREASERALAEQERSNTELKRLDKVKDEFLANTSHELRTPLHGILGLTEGVLRSAGGLDRGSRDRLEMVVASGRRLAALVNDILDFSKLRHQGLELREKNVDLHGAVAMTLAVLAPSAGPKGVALVNEVRAGTTVRADESRLQQILTNLVGNAVKFTQAGSVTVRAGTLESERVGVFVQDTGIGIEKEAQARIFESFEQADGSTAREFGGTGLGLAVTKKLVELHGGSIRVESEVGRGSTFAFDVAAGGAVGEGRVAVSSSSVAPDGAIAAASSEPLDQPGLGSIGAMPVAKGVDAPSTGRARGARLLVADDDPVNVEVLRAQLEPEGHEVVVARDGAQALAALERTGPFDGVLLDVMMPKMTGPQAAEQMRAQYPHGTLPILMLTAKNRPEDAVTGLRAGADDYVGKPFHRDELLARLDVHLDAAKTTRALERFVRPRLVELAGKARPGELMPGEGRGLNALLARFTIEGLGELAAKHDERTFFERVGRVVRALVEQVELHGGVVEAMSDDQLSAIFVGDAEGALLGAQRALWAARDVSTASLHVAAILHAGAVNVGAVGADDWIAVHALGEAALVASAVGRWAARAGFGLVATDTLFAKLETAPRHRYLGAARVGAGGHPAGLHEIGEGLAPYDEALRALEHGDAARAATACEHAPREDHLVRAILEAAQRRQRDIAIL